MEGIFLILKLSFLCLFLSINTFAIDVLISKDAIKFEEKINASKLKLPNINEINKACRPLRVDEIQNEEYISSHYINKNTIICQKDVKKQNDEGIVFNFGGLKIEKKGKIIYENNEFIRIKNLDGTIEQIYKDGRTK